MNNYLETIVARTLNPTSPLRPRLPGPFEEAPALQSPIEGSRRLRAGSLQPVPAPQTTEQSGALNTTRPHVEYRSALSLDPTPHSEQSADTTTAVSRAAPPVTDHKITPSPSVPAVSATPSALPGTSRQTLNIRSPSIKERVDVNEQSGATDGLPPPRLPERAPGPNRERVPFRFPAPDDHAAVNDSTLKPRQSPKADKTSQKRDDEADSLPHSRRRRQKELKEREVERIIIREKAVAGEPRERLRASSAPSPTIPALSQITKSGNPGSEPFVPSRIAPRIDNRTEQLGLRRRNAPAQQTVHVTIGRLEVRAVQSSHVPPKPQTAGPVMNLEDYLKRRSQGGTR